MASAARERLARTLRGDTQTAFSVELTARTGDLSLEVEGRPYTLVLNKTDALFSREREARIKDEPDLKWLAAERASHPSGSPQHTKTNGPDRNLSGPVGVGAGRLSSWHGGVPQDEPAG